MNNLSGGLASSQVFCMFGHWNTKLQNILRFMEVLNGIYTVYIHGDISPPFLRVGRERCRITSHNGIIRRVFMGQGQHDKSNIGMIYHIRRDWSAISRSLGHRERIIRLGCHIAHGGRRIGGKQKVIWEGSEDSQELLYYSCHRVCCDVQSPSFHTLRRGKET